MDQVDGQTAKEISELLLEVTGRGLLAGDFDGFSTAFHLPHTVDSPAGTYVLRAREDLRSVFQSVRKIFVAQGVTDLVRVCESAVFQSPTRVGATHVTHFMAKDRRVNNPFPTYSVLERHDGQWKIATSQYAMDPDSPEGRTLKPYPVPLMDPVHSSSDAGDLPRPSKKQAR